MQSKFKRILFGGDYNPNQWPKEVWKQDMAYFKDAHINSATINVFSWAKIQPSENIFLNSSKNFKYSSFSLIILSNLLSKVFCPQFTSL